MIKPNFNSPLTFTGKWTHEGFPERISIRPKRGTGQIDYVKARWAKSEKGVLAQYRENTSKESTHLKVYDNGMWRIDHIDSHNPDKGSAVGHFFQDYNPLIGPLLFAGTLLVGSVAYIRRKIKPGRESTKRRK